jgi:hypothetical protein
LFGGLFPAVSIAEARAWARSLNEQVAAGIDPRAAQRDEKARNEMTVAKAHDLYMATVREGRSSRAKRVNKPRTIKDKLEIYHRDAAPKLATRSIHQVTERDLIKLVEAGLRVVCVEILHRKALLKAQKINKSDRNDARGIAQMMRVGLFKPVHVKTPAA